MENMPGLGMTAGGVYPSRHIKELPLIVMSKGVVRIRMRHFRSPLTITIENCALMNKVTTKSGL